tara:strand:+ start:72 stop:422 length:351 start_codon:yes stop_codon:yes gene_type:complete
MRGIDDQAGFCMLEVLIAWSLVVLVTLLVLSLERESIQQIHQDWLYCQAMHAAANLAELYRADPKRVISSKIYQEWLKQSNHHLPQLQVQLSCDQGLCDVDLSWRQGHHYHLVFAS